MLLKQHLGSIDPKSLVDIQVYNKRTQSLEHPEGFTFLVTTASMAMDELSADVLSMEVDKTSNYTFGKREIHNIILWP